VSNGVRRSVQAALIQWGRAFTHIDSRVDYIFKTDDYIASGKEARDLLSPVVSAIKQ
jgi:hypothetical protein